MKVTFINKNDETKKIELMCNSITSCDLGFVVMCGDSLTYIGGEEWLLLNVRTSTHKHKELMIPTFMR